MPESSKSKKTVPKTTVSKNIVPNTCSTYDLDRKKLEDYLRKEFNDNTITVRVRKPTKQLSTCVII